MAPFSTYLIESNDLSREGLKSFLATTEFKVADDFRHMGSLLSLPPENCPQLIIVGIQRHLPMAEEHHESVINKLMEDIAQVREKFNKARLVVLLSRDSIMDMPSVCNCPANGYILEDVSRTAFISYLHLVMAGEKVFPPDMATFFIRTSNGKSRTNGEQPHPLSEREADILRCLAMGEANKLIARRLDITEATVKVHLKTILRKLHLCNRTQAALWAVRHGYMEHNSAPARPAASSEKQASYVTV